MIPGKKFTIGDVVPILMRRRWWLITPIVVCTVLALFVSRFLPNRYQAETLIQIIPQRVPDNYVRPTVTSDLTERLKSISQQIVSRPRLEALITDLDLYPEDRKSHTTADVAQKLHDAIEITIAPPGRSRGRITDPDSFTVRFTYSEPHMTQAVTERLATWFVNENTRLRGMQADSTNVFLEQQLADARRRLEAQEKKLEAFRQQHAGRLPSELQSNMQGVQSAQMQLQSLTSSLENDRGRKAITERLYNDAVLAAQTAAQAPLPPPPSGDPNASTTGSFRQQLETARANLARLELRMTPEHPDVIKARRTIADLEPKAAAEAKQAAASGGDAPRVMSPEEQHRRERVSSLRAELDGINRSISAKENQEAALRGTIASFQSRIAAVPGLESEWVSLSRDYDTLQESYRTLLQKSEESRIAANLEKQQIGEQFTVLEPADLPTRPKSPQRLLINGGGFAFGIMLGLALVGLLEFFDQTYRTEGDVLGALNLPVLAVVPRVRTPAELRDMARRRLWTSVALGAAALGTLGTFVALHMWRYLV